MSQLHRSSSNNPEIITKNKFIVELAGRNIKIFQQNGIFQKLFYMREQKVGGKFIKINNTENFRLFKIFRKRSSSH